MRKYLLLLAIVVGLLWVGLQKTYVYFTNRKPTQMTARQFLTLSPSAKWLELSDCKLDYFGAIRLQSRVLKVDKGTYIPVRPVGAEGPAKLLLKINSEDLAPRLERLISALPAQGEAGSVRKGETVAGLVQFGIDSESKVRDALDREVTAGKLQKDYIIIDDGAKPNPMEAFTGISLVLGALAVVTAWALGRRKRGTPPPAPPPVGTAAPAMPVSS